MHFDLSLRKKARVRRFAPAPVVAHVTVPVGSHRRLFEALREFLGEVVRKVVRIDELDS